MSTEETTTGIVPATGTIERPPEAPADYGDTPELKDVPGPAAFGGGRRRTLELLYLISINDFKRTYFGTVLGYVWTLARPLILFGVLYLVFTEVFRIGASVPHYPVLLLFNIVLFGFFQESVGIAVTSIMGQESLVRKTQFPRIIIPLSIVLTSLINLALNMIVVGVFLIAFGVPIIWTWLLFPVFLVGLVIFTTAMSTIVASLYPRFRDIAIIWSVASTVLFYASPILYPIEAGPRWLQKIVIYNPITPMFETARKWVIDDTARGPQAIAGWGPLIGSGVVYVVICALAWWILNREAPRIAEEL